MSLTRTILRWPRPLLPRIALICALLRGEAPGSAVLVSFVRRRDRFEWPLCRSAYGR